MLYIKRIYGICVASQATLGKKVKLSASTVRRWLKTLVDDGFLELVDNPIPYSTQAYRDTEKIVMNIDEIESQLAF